MNDKEIANILDFSQSTARNIRCNLGLLSLVSGRKPAVPVVIDHKELKKLFEKGLSDNEISEFFGVSENTILNHRQNLGLLRWKKWERTADNIKKFKQLYYEGLSDRKIGNILGICIDTARKIRHDLGLPPQPLSRKYVNTEELKHYMAIGLTDKEIGDIFGVSDRTIYERRCDIGLFRRKKQTLFENINIDDFKKLYTAGMSDVKIAKALGVQNQALIREIRNYLGLAPNNGKKHLKMRELYDLELSDNKIAETLKVRKNDVTTWRQSHKLPANNYDDEVTDAQNVKLANPIKEKPIRIDLESLFYDTEFLENYLGKEIT
jgi:DNA-binding CsgD family transcriptional regulator